MGTRVYFDAMLFVYLIESNPEFGLRTKQIREWTVQRQATVCTSIFTVGEVLTGPFKRRDPDLASQVHELIRPPNVELLPFDRDTAVRYAKIRSSHRVSPGDAIHLACAAEGRVNLFLTNDHGLKNLIIPGIDFIAGLDVNLF